METFTNGNGLMFLPCAYKQRCRIIAESFLFEAQHRGKQKNQGVYAVVTGFGLGVWAGCIRSKHGFTCKTCREARKGKADTNFIQCQNCYGYGNILPPKLLTNLFVEAFLDTLVKYKDTGKLSKIRCVEFNYGDCFATEFSKHSHVQWIGNIKIAFTKKDGQFTSLHYRDGSPFAKLPNDFKDCLLVANYAWDGNSYPGNELYAGMLIDSGDPAAACCSTIGWSQNPEVNPENVSGEKTMVIDPNKGGLFPIQAYF